MKNVSAIICSDLHLRETAPVCRLDNWMETMERKYTWLKELQEKYGVPILCGGDVFDYWKSSPFLLSWALRNLPKDMVTVCGQHDLPAHNLDNLARSGLGVLAEAGKVELLSDSHPIIISDFDVKGFSWGSAFEPCDVKDEYAKVAIIHYGVYEDKPHYLGAENHGGTAKSVIKKLGGFDLIVAGDNHLSFVTRVEQQVLVNAGSFMRTSAAQLDFKPSVYLWCSETNEVERVFVPIESGVISREHIDKVDNRDERLEAFISRLDHNIDITISYNDNMRNYLAKNDIKKSVSNIIWEAMKNE